ncbi:hypothetical protein GCM10011583_51240 [Streptomyces camponoticapitis]|uniref:Uncharacterized protein n=1 Tax=Streptomyces camponoticapitis TaxID=1616125 RepID=A0ABQ2EKR9_9ACTN|nr:hypothetical protein [Streptomyces camponoticapitis]GGK13037.1 hypothetical protein GCM10011583_51240 [Streptomyces camponoticapitis]
MSTQARLLPWPGEDGQRSYLVTDDGQSYLSTLANEMEEVQLRTGETLLDHAAAMLRDNAVSTRELRFLSRRLSEALHDALRVAESRGSRLPASDEDDEPEDAVTVAEGRQDEPGHTRPTETTDGPGSHLVSDP